MRMIIRAAAVIAASAASICGAQAAPIEYCEAYARETLAVLTAAGMARETPQVVHDRAYFACLNMDDEPPMPSTLAQGTVAGDGAVEQGSTEADEPARVTAPAEPAKRRGKIAKGTPEWAAWCRRHFPNSFDESTGTVIPLDTGRRSPCPIG